MERNEAMREETRVSLARRCLECHKRVLRGSWGHMPLFTVTFQRGPSHLFIPRWNSSPPLSCLYKCQVLDS